MAARISPSSPEDNAKGPRRQKMGMRLVEPAKKAEKRSFLGMQVDDSRGRPPKVPLQLLNVENFGSIRFPGSSQQPSKWARLPNHGTDVTDEHTEALMKLLVDTWGLRPPAAVISVLGPWQADPDTVLLDKPLLPIFKRALVQAATTSRAWVFTRGLSGEVVSLVGRALEDVSVDVPCIGFAPWALVAEREQLSQSEGAIHYYQTGKAVTAATAPSRSGNDRVLDPCHTHFLLVDDGDSRRHDAAVAVRTKLRLYISNKDVSGNGIQTPVLSLVLNGDDVTLRLMLSSIEDDRSPVIAFSDTGGAATLLYEYKASGDDEKGREHFLAELRQSASDWTADPQVHDTLRRLLQPQNTCVRRVDGSEKNLLSFVSLRELEEDDLDAIMRSAVLSGCRTQREELLLAVTWGDTDVLKGLLESESEWGGGTGASDALKKRQEKGLALETALLRRDVQVASCLVGFHAEAAYVLPAILFDRSLITYDKRTLHAELWHEHASSTDLASEANRTSADTALRAKLPGAAKWTMILRSLVDGYETHMSVRESLLASGEVKATWTDLMLWAVIIGEMELAHMLWRQSRMPLRAALMASQLCLRLSKHPRNSADMEDLEASAKLYERWALDLLDAMPESVAHPVLALIRGVRVAGTDKVLPLWDASAFDSATQEDGRLSVACKDLVSHKHAVSLAECYFVGDFPGSSARIYEESTWIQILLQILLPFLPGTACEVLASTWPLPQLRRRSPSQRSRAPAIDESSTKVLASDENAEVSTENFERRERAKPERGEDEEPEDWAVRAQARTRFLEEHSMEKALGASDLADDCCSLRFLHFYMIPKVKFAFHQLFYLMYILMLPIILICDSVPDDVEWALPSRLMAGEVVFWILSISRLMGEVEQFELLIPDPASGSLCSRLHAAWRLYLQDAWNICDMMSNGLIVTAVSLRLSALEDTNAQIWARALYGVVIVLQWLRLLQVSRISKSVGVLSIILGRMMAQDIMPFFILLLIVSPAFGLALAVLIPAQLRGEEEPHEATIFRYLDSAFWTPWFALTAGFEMDSLFELSRGVVVMEWLIPLLALLYELFAIVVVLNLLIAAMGATFAELDEKAKIEWQYERVQLILEYKDQKMFPPPLNMIHIVLRIITNLLGFRGAMMPSSESGFKLHVSQAEELFLQVRELEALRKCHAKHVADKHETESLSRVEESVNELNQLTTTNFEKLMTQAMLRNAGATPRLNREPSYKAPPSD